MEIFLDDFEKDRTRHFEFEVAGEAAAKLFEDTDVTAKGFEVVVDVERVGTTLIIDGHVRGDLMFTCGRCLREREYHFESDGEWVLMNRTEWDSRYEDEDEVELGEEDLDVSFYEGESVEIDPLVRELVLLELPSQLKCAEDDPSCEAAFEALVGEDVLQENEDTSVDLRWAALKNIKLKE